MDRDFNKFIIDKIKGGDTIIIDRHIDLITELSMRLKAMKDGNKKVGNRKINTDLATILVMYSDNLDEAFSIIEEVKKTLISMEKEYHEDM